MKTILRIARFELSTLFYSPIAWLVLIVFVVQTAFSYTDAFDLIDRFFKMNYPIDQGLTFTAIAHPMFGMFVGVLENIYLYIPLLTMGLISKEISSGSIKLVLSSPITARELVFGKYFAMLGYCLIMVAGLFLFLIAAGISIKSADYGLILSGIFGFFMLTAVYSAIGLFISSLTSYQVVAAIGTLALLAGLNYVGRLGQGIPLVEDLTYWLSISGRANEMVGGLISTADIIYFLVIIGLFLSFTIIKISSGREVASFWMKSRRYIALFGIAAVLAYVSSRPGLIGYLDTTATKFNTLTDPSKDIVNKIDGPLKMTNYVNILDGSSFVATPRSHKRDFGRFENYKRYLPQLENEYVYFYDTLVGQSYLLQDNPGMPLAAVAKKAADVFDMDINTILTPEQIKQHIDLSDEDNQFVRRLSFNGKESIVRMFDDQRQYPSEYEMSAALKRLVEVPVKLLYVTGHNERDFEKGADKDYQRAMTMRTYRESMLQKGFDFERVNLEQNDISTDKTILIIADPETAYSETEKAKITAYIQNGGNAMILGEPDTRDNVGSLVETLGVQFADGMLQQENEGFESDFILADFSEEAEIAPEKSAKYREKERKVSLPNSMVLNVSAQNGYSVKNYLEVKSTNTTVQQDSAQTKSIGGPVAVTLTKEVNGKQQRIFVAGDADFLNNVENARNLNGLTKNADMVGEIFGWLTYGEYPVNADRIETPDMVIKIEDTGKKITKVSLIGIIPFIILLFGARVLIRRRRN